MKNVVDVTSVTTTEAMVRHLTITFRPPSHGRAIEPLPLHILVCAPCLSILVPLLVRLAR